MILLHIGKMGEGMSYGHDALCDAIDKRNLKKQSAAKYYITRKEEQNYRIIKKLQLEIDSRFKDLKLIKKDRDFLIFLQQELDTLKTNICPHWRHIEHHEDTNTLTLIDPSAGGY